MTKSQLIQMIAEMHGLSKQSSEMAVSLVLGEIVKAMERGERVELRGFGVFEVRERQARQARNPKTGTAVSVPEKRVPFFKAGKEMRERVDGGK
uniref:Integration host factor beta-subunit (IHF-beta) n=1 Tax=Magnetococcus massalia (strain MO-1) TaxID=451514 RepID=A0A1S7LHJ4_MAGMO|nr:Integration host factor beta-subunit (IHF-beta) [Candidatus Magnetococcus massalia]